jgi:peroxiredoxin
VTLFLFREMLQMSPSVNDVSVQRSISTALSMADVINVAVGDVFIRFDWNQALDVASTVQLNCDTQN